MDDPLHILGFAGSLRRESFNKAILRAAGELLPGRVELETFDLSGIPLFNQDQEMQPPESVVRFKEKIKSADALLIATPEYNYSIPGVLKNAIDWASRPKGDNVFDGKPVAIMGASGGLLGTVRAQYHLRQVCVALNMQPLNRPEVMVATAQKKIDSEGRLTDESTREFIRQLMESLAEWTGRLRRV